MSKEYKPHGAFHHNWFKKHQKKLLWFCNTPLVGKWFRWVLDMRVDTSMKIEEIMPDRVMYNKRMFWCEKRKEWRIGKTSQIRTHWKFAKRIYEAFKPMWWTMHFFDWLILDDWFPNYSFGFTELTVYVEGQPESVAMDAEYGYVDAAGVSWSTMRDASTATSALDNNQSSDLLRAQIETDSPTDTWDQFYRCSVGFDTSSIGDDDVDTAHIHLYHLLITDELLQDFAFCEFSPLNDTTADVGDWDAFTDTKLSEDFVIDDMTQGQYTEHELNAAGREYAKTSPAHYGIRISSDIDDAEPAWQNNKKTRLYIRSADNPGTSEDPYAVFNHSEPASGGAGSGLTRLAPNF